MSRSDDWDTPTWGTDTEDSEVLASFDDDDDESEEQYWDRLDNASTFSTESVDATPTNRERRPIKFSYKMVAIIIAVAFILLAIILNVIGSIKPKSKPVQSNTTQTTVSTQASSDALTMNIVGDSVSIDYTAEVVSAVGVVSSKTKYAFNGQLVHCLNISTESKSLQYFCGYGAYKSIAVGDVVTVKYQQVSSGTVSVYDVRK